MARKVKVNIPKGSKDCNGAECDKNYEFDIDVPETTTTVQNIPTPGVSTIQQMAPPQVVYQQAPPAPPPTEKPADSKKLSHDEIADMIPKGTNFMSCPGGDCGHKKLKNPKQIKKFKTCPHCEANTVHKGSEFCSTCGKNIEDEELEDGVSLEEEEEDE